MKKLGDVEDCFKCRKLPGVVRGTGITFCCDCLREFVKQLEDPSQRLAAKSTCSMCYEILPMQDGRGVIVQKDPDFTICEMCIEVMVGRYCDNPPSPQ